LNWGNCIKPRKRTGLANANHCYRGVIAACLNRIVGVADVYDGGVCGSLSNDRIRESRLTWRLSREDAQ